MGLYEVTVQSEYFSQLCVNRWNYLGAGSPGTTTGAFGLAFAMGLVPTGDPPVVDPNSILGLMLNLQSTAVIYDSFLVRNVYDPLDFYSGGLIGITGLSTGGETEAPFIAYGLRSNRVRLDIRRGYKRLVGVVENAVTAGGVLVPAILTALQLIANAMSDPLDYSDSGATLTFNPCIVSKQPYTTPSGNTAYQYYPTEAQQLLHLAENINFEPYQNLRSQTSRQYGRGA